MTGAELQKLRKHLGVTGAEFARAFEVHERTLRSWEGSIHKGRLVPVPRAVAILTRLALKNPSIRHELGLSKKAREGIGPDPMPDAAQQQS